MAAAQSRARDLMVSHGVKIAVPPFEEIAAKRREMLTHQGHLATLSRISSEMVAAVTAELSAS
jgi:hypothetical protein